jgi:hypothetical protein
MSAPVNDLHLTGLQGLSAPSIYALSLYSAGAFHFKQVGKNQIRQSHI